MKIWLMMYWLLLGSVFQLCAQSSDLIVLKRRDGRRIQTFMPGTSISVDEFSGAVHSGRIRRIDRDTIQLEVFDVRRLSTSMGGVIFDTVSRQLLFIHYKDIASVLKPVRGFGYLRNGSLIRWSAIAYSLLHVANAVLSKEPVIPLQLGTAGAALGAGILLGRLYRDSYTIGRRYRWNYIDM